MSAAENTQERPKPLPVEVQHAIMRLSQWRSGKRLLDHGYDVTADLDVLFGLFTYVIEGPNLE